MDRGEAEYASGSSAMRVELEPSPSNCHQIGRPARRRYWMARGGYLFSVALKPVISGYMAL